MWRSLQNRLLVFLSLLGTAVAVIQALVVYHNTLEEINTILDEQLQRMAHSLAGPAAVLRLRADIPHIQQEASIVIQIWGIDGQVVYRSSPDLAPPPFTIVGFSEQKGYRSYALRTPFQIVQVSQPLQLRTQKARTVALQTVFPIMFLAGLFLVAVLLVVYWTLRPLKKLRREIASRAVDQFAPINTHKVPLELLPLLNEFNALIARIQKSYQSQKQFVGDAAHELRTPLTGLQLQIQALQRTSLDSEQKTYIQRLSAAIQRNILLVEQLLTLAQWEHSPPQLNAPLDFSQTIEQVLKETADWAPQAIPHIQVQSPTVPIVLGDPTALHILVRNLLKNAIQYSPPQTPIHITLLHEAPYVILQIEDSGPGIPLAEQHNVLQRFYRLQPQHTGSGLGLAIVQSIVEAHHARLSLDSSPELHGLRVRIFFTSSPPI